MALKERYRAALVDPGPNLASTTTHVYECTYIYVHVYIRVRIYIYIYIYIYVYVYIRVAEDIWHAMQVALKERYRAALVDPGPDMVVCDEVNPKPLSI